eukprot:6175323-Pleurochrysis_carterae.AAC.2
MLATRTVRLASAHAHRLARLVSLSLEPPPSPLCCRARCEQDVDVWSWRTALDVVHECTARTLQQASSPGRSCACVRVRGTRVHGCACTERRACTHQRTRTRMGTRTQPRSMRTRSCTRTHMCVIAPTKPRIRRQDWATFLKTRAQLRVEHAQLVPASSPVNERGGSALASPPTRAPLRVRVHHAPPPPLRLLSAFLFSATALFSP